MIKRLISFTFILAMFFAIALITGCAGKKMLSPDESLKVDFPKIDAKSIKPSAIEGVYEVNTSGNIVYYDPKSANLIIGEIYSKSGENLTALSKNLLVKDAIKELPLEKAIKIGDGKNTIIMWTDPDCPYCRKIEDYFKNKIDITRYVYLFPLEQLHPKAMAKSENIMCQKNEDRVKVFIETMSGAFDKEVNPCKDESIKNVLKEHKASGQKIGVRGTPYLIVNGTVVHGANIKTLDKLLTGNAKN